MRGWPGAYRGEHPSDALTSVVRSSVFQARRGSAYHLWQPGSTAYTLCGKNAMSMTNVRAHQVVGSIDYWSVHTDGERFELLLRRITCSACMSRWLAMRLLAADGELAG